MKLRLNVISYHNQPTSLPMCSVFDMQGGTIGRAADNEWVLPDPDRFISGKHAQISIENERFYLTDISTNGIYLNNQPQPIGKGNSIGLTNGDHILIGDYVIEVSLEESPNTGPITTEPKDDFFNPFEVSHPDQINPLSFDDTDSNISTGPTTNSLFSAPEIPPVGSEPDHVPAANEFFQPPQSIPDDWNFMEDNLDSVNNFAPSQLTAPLPEPPPQPQHPAPVPVAPSPKTVVSNDLESLNKLLEGAGIQPLAVSSEQASDRLRTIGSLMREMIGGVMEILRARAEIKSEFRMQLTTIRPVENNPLKFSVNVEDAISHLMGASNNAYLKPMEAVQQAIEDIEAHQMAVMAGMQAALSAMLQRFEPRALEEYFARKGGRSLLESKKAWFWEQYAEKHKEILMEAEDNFQDLFGEEFTRAYETQINKLVQARKKD